MDASYRAALRGLMARLGQPVEINREDRAQYPDDPGMWVSVYGWRDYQAMEHGRECGWIVPESVVLTEVTYSEFTDTYSDNDQTVGINVESTKSADIRCTCGQYTSMTLRWDGTLREALEQICGAPKGNFGILL
jgi:hypothetical protein